MVRSLLLAFFLGLSGLASAQSASPTVARPKLVVGIMIDQMRYDYLYRFYDRYGTGGFRRMLNTGMSCENTMIPYAQTVTAAGHTCVYTGSVPAIHGIMGNEWFDKSLNRDVYCAEDKNVKLVGVTGGEPMSPVNMWTTTICDELRLATNFRSKVVGVAIKDRGGILPAGHSANAAYWYDGVSGKWITSTWYMNELPGWVDAYNSKKWVDSFYQKDWNTLYPINTYLQSDEDDVAYEGKLAGDKAPVFPHELKSRTGKDYGAIRVTPWGNTMTLQFAKEALKGEAMGKDAITDFLAVSLSSTDYIGHTFGPNSIEIEDTYLRLDRDLAEFFRYLDKEVGAGQYTVFLTADHAVAHVPAFMKKHQLPAEVVSSALVDLNKTLAGKFAASNLIRATANYQFYLNDSVINAAGLNPADIKKAALEYLNKNPKVLIAFDNASIPSANLPQQVREMFVNGYNQKRAGDIQVVLKSGYISGGQTGTTHGVFYAYDAHIPLVWMGWGIKPGKLNREVYMTDIAVTLAALLHTQMPSGAIGDVIPEVLK